MEIDVLLINRGRQSISDICLGHLVMIKHTVTGQNIVLTSPMYIGSTRFSASTLAGIRLVDVHKSHHALL